MFRYARLNAYRFPPSDAMMPNNIYPCALTCPILHNNTRASAARKGGLMDDPQWLPAGPPGRLNKDGVKRFQKGYLAYAGGGKNSRGTQLILAFQVRTCVYNMQVLLV